MPCRTVVKLLLPAIAAGILSGCAVSTYCPTSSAVTSTPYSATTQYNIVSAEIATLKSPDDSGILPPDQLDFLRRALSPGKVRDFAGTWDRSVAALDAANGYLNIRSDGSGAYNLSSRCADPNLFSSDGTPVKVKTAMAFSPMITSGGWMTFYLLTLTMAPMKQYCYGAMAVTVIDKDNRVMGTRVVGLRHAVWFSVLFPTALFGHGDFEVSGGGFRDLTADEQSMLAAIAVRAVADILANGDRQPDPRWENIRASIAEALISGRSDEAAALLDKARPITAAGKKELENFRSGLGL